MLENKSRITIAFVGETGEKFLNRHEIDPGHFVYAGGEVIKTDFGSIGIVDFQTKEVNGDSIRSVKLDLSEAKPLLGSSKKNKVREVELTRLGTGSIHLNGTEVFVATDHFQTKK